MSAPYEDLGTHLLGVDDAEWLGNDVGGRPKASTKTAMIPTGALKTGVFD
jgi:hypothetical protein